MKVIGGYVYIGSEADGHGLQVFGMRKVDALYLACQDSHQPKMPYSS